MRISPMTPVRQIQVTIDDLLSKLNSLNEEEKAAVSASLERLSNSLHQKQSQTAGDEPSKAGVDNQAFVEALRQSERI